ncbi:MAG: ABC transporter substrate-binding protein [Anaerolineae bacterium]|nr:ABC transporter substrate-binding protein [Anaerolineae bacterium]
MKRNQQQLLIPILISLSLLLQSCGASTPAPPQEQSPPDKVKVLLLPFLGFAPFVIADQEGYFIEQNLDVEFIQMYDSASVLTALVSGEIDVAANYASVNIFNAIAQDANLKFVAGKGYVDPNGCEYHGLLARNDLIESGELDTVEQLAGRKIAMDATTVEGYYVSKVLASGGLTLADVETVQMQIPDEPAALESGQLDLTATSEPWVTRIQDMGHASVWRPVQELIPDFQFAVIYFGPQLLGENHDIGNRFMIAYLKAVRQYNEGKTDRNLEILVEFTGLEQDVLQRSCWPQIRNDGKISSDSLLDFQSWAVSEGFLDAIVPVEEFWDPSFAEYANAALAP